MFKFDFTKKEVQDLKEKIYLNEMQQRILEYRILDYSITKMSLLEHCSESKISAELKKIKKKITKVI